MFLSHSTTDEMDLKHGRKICVNVSLKDDFGDFFKVFFKRNELLFDLIFVYHTGDSDTASLGYDF